MKGYLSIGAVAKRKGISIKSLRYYDKIGVLRPAYINKKTNYRYYTEDQLYLLDAIGLCIELGIPLRDFENYVDGHGNFNLQGLLYDGKLMAEQKIMEIRKRLAGVQAALQSLEGRPMHFHGEASGSSGADTADSGSGPADAGMAAAALSDAHAADSGSAGAGTAESALPDTGTSASALSVADTNIPVSSDTDTAGSGSGPAGAGMAASALSDAYTTSGSADAGTADSGSGPAGTGMAAAGLSVADTNVPVSSDTDTADSASGPAGTGMAAAALSDAHAASGSADAHATDSGLSDTDEAVPGTSAFSPDNAPVQEALEAPADERDTFYRREIPIRAVLTSPLSEDTLENYSQRILRLFMLAQLLGMTASYPSGILYQYDENGSVKKYIFIQVENYADCTDNRLHILPEGTYLCRQGTEHQIKDSARLRDVFRLAGKPFTVIESDIIDDTLKKGDNTLELQLIQNI